MLIERNKFLKYLGFLSLGFFIGNKSKIDLDKENDFEIIMVANTPDSKTYAAKIDLSDYKNLDCDVIKSRIRGLSEAMARTMSKKGYINDPNRDLYI